MRQLLLSTFTKLLLVGTMFSVNLSYAEMLISPLRAVLTADTNSATFTLRNTSDGPRTYRLGWVEQTMEEDGRYRRIKEDVTLASAASPYIRFSPRQITVGPGENQTVRLSYRPPKDLAPGEYRSHLMFKVMPDVSEPTATTEMESGMEGISMKIHMQMSFTIPVLIRHQVAPPEMAISNIEMLPADANYGRRMEVTLSRTGNSSSFGRMVVEMQTAKDKPVEVIGYLDDIAVFAEMPRRKLLVPMKDITIPQGAWIRVAYEGRQEYQGTTWAEQVFQAN